MFTWKWKGVLRHLILQLKLVLGKSLIVKNINAINAYSALENKQKVLYGQAPPPPGKILTSKGEPKVFFAPENKNKNKNSTCWPET